MIKSCFNQKLSILNHTIHNQFFLYSIYILIILLGGAGSRLYSQESGNAQARINNGAFNDNMKRLYNPEIDNYYELIWWVQNFDEDLGIISEIFPQFENRDLELGRELVDHLQLFLNRENVEIQKRFIIAFLEQKWIDANFARSLNGAEREISGIFNNELKLPPLEGKFLVIVTDKPEGHQSIAHTAGYTIKASRVIVVFRSYFNEHDWKLPDYEAFQRTIKHELVHAHVNTYAGYWNSMNFPEWFQEVVAINLAGDRKFDIHGNTIVKMPKKYLEWYRISKFLTKKYGQYKFYEFVRFCLVDGDLTKGLYTYYGYKNYDELDWASLNVFQKASTIIARSWHKMVRRLKSTSFGEAIFLLIGIMIPLALIYFSAGESVQLIKDINQDYRSGIQLDKDSQFDDALITFRKVLENLQKVSWYETLFVAKKKKEKHCVAQVEMLQRKILESGIDIIEREKYSNIYKAEAECYLLEEKQFRRNLFENEFLVQYHSYINKNAPALIRKAFNDRLLSVNRIETLDQSVEFLRDIHDYEFKHRISRFFPRDLYISYLSRLLQKCQYFVQHEEFKADKESIIKLLDSIKMGPIVKGVYSITGTIEFIVNYLRLYR